jgi:hypothetical protein
MWVSAGDLIHVSTSVSGRAVTLTVIDATSHWSAIRRARPRQIVDNSADWIVEDPGRSRSQTSPRSPSATRTRVKARAANRRISTYASSPRGLYERARERPANDGLARLSAAILNKR